MTASGGTPYLLSGQPSERDRLQLQSRVWEPAGRSILAEIQRPVATPRALDVGCGPLGWLRVLAEWAGPDGRVTGTDIDDKMLGLARAFVGEEALSQVEIVKDDLFASALPDHAFDLVHARFELAPLGRASEQLAAYRRFLRPGGILVLEEPDAASWRVNPEAPSVARLIALIEAGFRIAGGDFNAGRALPGLLRGLGGTPTIRAKVIALAPGHPYLRLPLQFASSLRGRLETLVAPAELDELMGAAEGELASPNAWGTTFTLIQAYASIPA